MAKATQDERLLTIATPLGDNYLLINKLRAEESLSELYEIDVELLFDEEEDASNQLTPVDITKILGQAVHIRIRQEDGVKRSMIGMVSRFTQLARDIRFTYYRAKIVPHVWKLTQIFRSRIFQQMSVRDILEEVLDGYETKVQLNGTYEPRNYCAQYRETDFDFISRLMQEEGIYYYFEHSGEMEKMVLRDDYLKPEDCPGKSDIPTFDTDVARDSDRWEGHIRRWFIDYNLISGSYEAWDYQSQLPLKKLDASMTSRFNVGGNQDMKVYNYPGGYGGLYDGVDSSGGDQSSSLDTIFEDNKKNAKNTMLSFDSQHQVVNGTSDCCALTAGYRFNLKNHPNNEYNISYIVKSVVHEADQSPDYIADKVIPNAYSNKFTCIPHGEGHPEFRPVKTVKKKRIHGSQTAMVVGPEGEEIFTDKYGRVKVQFNWDQDGELNASSSCWVPVSQGWAGNKWGMVFTPRIGMEVVVDFLDGDPDRPVVQGCVYNPNTMPHYELPKYKTLSYIKSSSSPDDTRGFNEIRFEDKQGKEQVFIHSQKRGDIRIKGSFYETCGGNRQERIGVRSDNQPGGNLAVTVGGNYDLHVKEAKYIGIDDKLNEAVAADVVEDYQGKQQTLVTGKRELNAQAIILEALEKISLKVGGNCIVIDPSGITIAATPMVKINSGGFGTETGNPTIEDPLDAASADTGEPGYLDRPRRGGGRRGRNSRQLRSQHYIAPPRPGEDARISAMRNTLSNSAQGRHALEVYDRYGVTPSFRAGEGSTFSGSSNNMNINPAQSADRQALGFVHEMNHAENHHEGTSADINNQTRSDYVDSELNEETEGVIRSIEARNELIDSGHGSAASTNYPLQNEYQQAYNQGVNDARAANPNISDEDAAAAGREAGRQRVRDGFTNGEVQTSNTNESYPDYYGNAWDRANPSP